MWSPDTKLFNRKKIEPKVQLTASHSTRKHTLSPMVVALSLPHFSSPRLNSPSSSRRPRSRPRPSLRSALVEARPRSAPGGDSSGGGGEYNDIRPADSAVGPTSLAVSARDRTKDLQAEARAMARAVNASVYSPQLLAQKYGSRPVKVRFLSSVSVQIS